MAFTYRREAIAAPAFADILERAGLAPRRPLADLPRLQRMLDHANLLLTARVVETGQLVGIARALTDWAYATYLADLAVDADFQRRGIGRKLIEETKALVGEESMLLLVAAPDAVGFYRDLGMPLADRAFLTTRTR